MGNHMILSAIWDKSAQVTFLKANQIAGKCNLYSLKNYPKLQKKNHAITKL